MYLLVKFYDDVYYVCPTSNIYNSKNRNTKAKYSDGFRYPANVIAKHNDKHLLEAICTNIESGKPYIMLQSLFVKSSENDYHKNIFVSTSHTCTSESFTCFDDITTAMNNGEISTNNDKTAIFNENCINRRNSEEDLSRVNTTEKKNCDNDNAQYKMIDVDSLESDCQKNISVPASYTSTSKSFTCYDNITKAVNNGEISTNNDKTAIFNENRINRRNSDEGLSRVNTTEKKNCDTDNAQYKMIDVDSLESDCQKNISVPASYISTSKSFTCYDNITKTMNNGEMSSKNVKTAISNQDYINVIKSKKVLSQVNTTNKTICDDVNAQNESDVDSLETDCQKNICVFKFYGTSKSFTSFDNTVTAINGEMSNNNDNTAIFNEDRTIVINSEEVLSRVNTTASIYCVHESATTINKTDSYKCNQHSLKNTIVLATDDNINNTIHFAEKTGNNEALFLMEDDDLLNIIKKKIIIIVQYHVILIQW